MNFPKNDFFSEAFRGIEESTYLWLIFEFNQIPDVPFNGLVRPPRFENKVKMGVYATRTPHRPNRLGLSLVMFQKLEILADEIRLTVAGVDLVDGTPILDIKPYLPYVEAPSGPSVFSHPPEFMKVLWDCPKVADHLLIEKVISLDPRPGQDKNSNQEYAVSIAGLNVKFYFDGEMFHVVSVEE